MHHDAHADVHVMHDAHDGHAPEPVHAAHALSFAKTDSPWLIVVPLMILGFLAVVSGYLNAAPFKIHMFERVDRIVDRRRASRRHRRSNG